MKLSCQQFIRKYSVAIIKELIRENNRIIKQIEKNNASMVDEPIGDTGTMRYWQKRSKHDVLMKELGILKKDIDYIFTVCNMKETHTQHRYNFIDKQLLKGWLDE